MMSALRIGVDGTLDTVQIDDSSPASRVRGINDAIGSERFDVVRYSESVDVWVDDEGLYNSTLNVELSVMIRGQGYRTGAWIGAGVFLGVNQRSGESRSLARDEQAQIIHDWNRPRQAGEYRFVPAVTSATAR